LPESKFTYTKGSVLNDPEIEAMMNAVDAAMYQTNLQNLQDYGTRNAYTSQSVLAQNWIKAQFESFGYPVELFDFSMPSGPASDDVIATKTGSKYPDEYVIIGGHYDSYSYSGNAPGADDDATGVCGVMEVARVMANWDSDRTILFCAWSGEEYGLYGSEAYATWCENQGLNILGYFNIDMCGYLAPGDPIHTDIIAPSGAQPLAAFYTDVCSMYLPDFIVGPGSLSGGDSDHTSFNNHGYMGIFPFEDSQNYSPYIHTSNDVIGTSVNSIEQAVTFTKAMVASVATMANWLSPPSNLMAIPGDEIIELNWDTLLEIDTYNIYKDGLLIGSTTEPAYTDTDVQNFTTYTYYVTAIYSETGNESNPSNIVTVTPLPPMAFPFTDDYETNALYWNFEGTWGLSTSQSYSPTHSMTESPNGNYGDDLDISATLYSFSLETAQSAQMSFWTKYALELNYDYTYLQISTNGINWTTLETFNGTMNSWTNKIYSLDAYLGEPFVQIRFRFTSDVSVTENGMFIDDFALIVEGTGTGVVGNNENKINVEVFPNPMVNNAQVMIKGLTTHDLEISFYSSAGTLIEKNTISATLSDYSYEFNSKGLNQGVYYCVVRIGNEVHVKKVTIIR
jgi:leucyl aminopeptidase